MEIFHRLKDWNVEPDIRSINLSMSQEQAFKCGEKDVVARLNWCMAAHLTWKAWPRAQ